MAWGDAWGRYAAKLGTDQTSIVYESNEGPILSQGEPPSEKFLQLPGVRAFLMEAGEEFLPDLGAYEKLLNDDVSLLYVARRGDRMHLLFDGRYIQAGKAALIEVAALQEALSKAGVSLPDRPVLVTGKGSWNQDFQAVFPGCPILYAEGLDADMISQNLQEVLRAGPLLPGNTLIYLGIPRDHEELQAAGIRQGWKPWDGVAQKWEKPVRRLKFEVASRGKRMAQQIEKALRKKDNVVIVIAHSDGEKIYLPDGTQLAPGKREEVLQSRPIVILVSCKTALVTRVTSLAKKLLDRGAKAVIAPYKDIYADDAALLEYLLEFSNEAVREGGRFIEILFRAIEASGAKFFRLLIGRNRAATPVYC